MKNIHFTLILCLIFFPGLIYSQSLGYYNGTENLAGEQLKNKLHEIIDNHVDFSYNQARYIINYTDADPANPGNVILFYLQKSRDADLYGTDGDYINREHVWAKSHGDFSGIRPMDGDVHNLRPADASVNEDRGNKDFDNVQPNGINHNEATQCWFTDYTWEPGPATKGQVARILFYMATRYEGGAPEIDLEVVNKINTFPLPEHGKLSTLIQWNNQYPPSDFERRRNERIFQIQQNRNPFVDNPDFVNLIWNEKLPSAIQFPEVKMMPEKPFTTDKATVSVKIISPAEPDSVVLFWGNSFDSEQNRSVLLKNPENYSTEIVFDKFQPGETVYFLIKAFAGNEMAMYRGSHIFPKQVDAGEITAISTVQGNSFESPAVGQVVTVTGRITANFDNTFYLQDNTTVRSGVCVFNALKTGNIGDSVVVKGKIAEYSTLTELTEVEYFYNFGNNKPIEPISINTSQITEDLEGMLVKIENVTFTDGGVRVPENNTSFRFSDDSGTSVLFSSYNSRLVGNKLPEDQTTITGIVSQYQNTYQILAREISDLSLETASDYFLTQKDVLVIYPNPAKASFTLETNSDVVSVAVFSMDGNLVLQKNGTEKQIDISELPPSVYFVRVDLPENRFVVRKLIKN